MEENSSTYAATRSVYAKGQGRSTSDSDGIHHGLNDAGITTAAPKKKQKMEKM